MKKILFNRKDYQPVCVLWNDGSKLKKRLMVVHKDLFSDSCQMRMPIIIGFCDRHDGSFSIMDVSDENK